MTNRVVEELNHSPIFVVGGGLLVGDLYGCPELFET